MKKISSICALLAIFCSSFFSSVYAHDLTFECNDSGCIMSPVGYPLFEVHNIQPLDVISQNIQIINTGSEQLRITLKIQTPLREIFRPNPFSNHILLSIQNSENRVLLSATQLAELSGESISLGIIPSEDTQNFKVIAGIDDLGNEYQNASVSFDADFEITAQTTAGQVLGVSELPVTGFGIQVILWALLMIFIGIHMRKHLSDRSRQKS